MRTAGIGPHVCIEKQNISRLFDDYAFLLCKLTRECDLLRRTLLKEQSVLGIE